MLSCYAVYLFTDARLLSMIEMAYDVVPALTEADMLYLTDGYPAARRALDGVDVTDPAAPLSRVALAAWDEAAVQARLEFARWNDQRRRDIRLYGRLEAAVGAAATAPSRLSTGTEPDSVSAPAATSSSPQSSSSSSSSPVTKSGLEPLPASTRRPASSAEVAVRGHRTRPAAPTEAERELQRQQERRALEQELERERAREREREDSGDESDGGIDVADRTPPSEAETEAALAEYTASRSGRAVWLEKPSIFATFNADPANAAPWRNVTRLFAQTYGPFASRVPTCGACEVVEDASGFQRPCCQAPVARVQAAYMQGHLWPEETDGWQGCARAAPGYGAYGLRERTLDPEPPSPCQWDLALGVPALRSPRGTALVHGTGVVADAPLDAAACAVMERMAHGALAAAARSVDRFLSDTTGVPTAMDDVGALVHSRALPASKVEAIRGYARRRHEAVVGKVAEKLASAVHSAVAKEHQAAKEASPDTASAAADDAASCATPVAPEGPAPIRPNGILAAVYGPRAASRNAASAAAASASASGTGAGTASATASSSAAAVPATALTVRRVTVRAPGRGARGSLTLAMVAERVLQAPMRPSLFVHSGLEQFLVATPPPPDMSELPDVVELIEHEFATAVEVAPAFLRTPLRNDEMRMMIRGVTAAARVNDPSWDDKDVADQFWEVARAIPVELAPIDVEVIYSEVFGRVMTGSDWQMLSQARAQRIARLFGRASGALLRDWFEEKVDNVKGHITSAAKTVGRFFGFGKGKHK